MAVPKFVDFFVPVLEVLAEKGSTKVKDLCPVIATRLSLTKDDLEQMIPSKKKYTYKDRIDWAVQYLKNAGLIERISHGVYTITETGKAALSSGKKIDLDYLEQFDSFKHFHSGTSGENVNPSSGSETVITDVSPQEAIETAYKTINDELAKGLLNEIMKASPDFFEKLVVDLLIAMGYGLYYEYEKCMRNIISTPLHLDILLSMWYKFPRYRSLRRYRDIGKIRLVLHMFV